MTKHIIDGENWDELMVEIGGLTHKARNGNITEEDIKEFGDLLSDSKELMTISDEMKLEQ